MRGLKSLSDRELVSRLRTLVKKEQDFTLQIIAHLVEVHRRGLYLEKAYASLYEYCKGELGYTDASAWRRARAAQAIVRCPAAWDSFREGRVNLFTLGRVHKFITPAVLREISNKSKPEVELIAAACDTKGVSPDRTRPVMVPKPVSKQSGGASGGAESRRAPDRENNGLRGEVNVTTQNPASSLRGEVDPSGREQPSSLRGEVGAMDQKDSPSLRGEVSGKRLEFEQKWKIEGVVSKDVKAKLDRCKSLLSRKYPKGVDYDILLGKLAESFLERTDPERKHERREKRKAGRRPRAKAAPKTRAKAALKATAPESRHIPAQEKEKVWIRDKGRCTYIGSNGKRCNSTFNLHFDHYPIPYARGGPSNASNLRLLCANHNKYTAEKTFGPRDYNNRPT